MVELDLSFVSFLALALIVGFLAGYSIRGLRRRRIEDMLLFFRQRDQEQDRKIALLERDISDARGRVLALRAEQAKNERNADDLRLSLEKALLEAARLRDEIGAAEAARSAVAAPPEPAAADESAAAEIDASADEPPATEAIAEIAPPAADEEKPPAAAPAKAEPAKSTPVNKKRPKRGRLP